VTIYTTALVCALSAGLTNFRRLLVATFACAALFGGLPSYAQIT